MNRQYSLGRDRIEYVMKNGSHHTSLAHFLFFSVKKCGNLGKIPKFAIVVSKKNFKLAVDRNRAKRRFREILRSFLKEIPQGEYVFILKKEINLVKIEEIRRDLEKYFI